MQQDTIIEGNILIAKFDGWVCDGNGNWKPLTGSYWKEFKGKEFSYHENWNNLMYIIKKINKICDETEAQESIIANEYKLFQ